MLLAGGDAKHEGGSGGVAQLVAGAAIAHLASTQVPIVRHSGLGSSPQVQCAAGGKEDSAGTQGGVHELPCAGGADGHAPWPEPPLPPVPAPPLPPVPALAAAPALPPGPELEVSPPHARQSAIHTAACARPRLAKRPLRTVKILSRRHGRRHCLFLLAPTFGRLRHARAHRYRVLALRRKGALGP